VKAVKFVTPVKTPFTSVRTIPFAMCYVSRAAAVVTVKPWESRLRGKPVLEVSQGLSQLPIIDKL
jgi:hypothetical protein